MTLCCWWCCHPSETAFLHMPYDQDHSSKLYKTVGNFCSWECMKAYAIDKYPSHRSGTICMYIRCIRKSNTILTCAPSRWSLNMFGGPFTIEEFRSKNNKEVLCIMPDCNRVSHLVIEQPTHTNYKPSSGELQEKMNCINKSSTVNEPLKLKRNKPLKRTNKANNLEISLGLVSK